MAVAIRLSAGLKPWAALMCALGALALTDTAAKAQHRTGDVFRDPFTSGSGQGPEMVVLPPGRFTMGSPASEPRGSGDEGPQRMVQIEYRLAVGRYEVSVDEFSAFAEETGWSPDGLCLRWFSGQVRAMPGTSWLSPGFEQSGDHPVTCVSWHDAQAYVAWLNHKTGFTNRADRYRLLSEAEWEYAVRAGTDTDYSFGDDDSQLVDHGWYSRDRFRPYGSTHPVGRKLPNAFALHDMHGNVWELVEDCYSDSYEDAPTDGSALTRDDCPDRVVRGGAWDSDPNSLRSAQRSYGWPNTRLNSTGLRVARTLPE
ncbi:formylglycine-generating enzyme family protein [uncultured Brevundimonas sp.]|uniref:formylglycine-generating enzyme family protein n=1 Tax=uncultured Brevundimonas sp. TaxID=213418 RepID=UPI0030EC5DE6